MKKIGVMDIGTNSIRMGVVRVDDMHEWHAVNVQKEVVRLGEREFAHNKITPEAMDRAVLVIKKFTESAKSQGAEEVLAIATAAVREAHNKAEFVNRVKSECGIDVKVVSGLEEARLIYLGIASGVDLNSHKGFFVDIGGGTTELIIGDAKEYYILESLKLGAIRLTDMFLEDHTDKVSRKKYNKIVEYAMGVGNQAFKKINQESFDLVFGASGTIINLAEITAKRVEPNLTTIRNYCLKYSDLEDTIKILCDANLEDRRKIPGINPERADIIICGAAILDAVMRGTFCSEIRISDRALRQGALIDYLFQEDHTRTKFLTTSARTRSILQMARYCRFEEKHAMNVTDLAEKFFEQLSELGLHNYGDKEAELLRYATMVHDVGTFISHIDHHKHSYYLIRNWSLLGFDDDEIEIIASTAMCHRKCSPKKAVAHKFNNDESKKLVEVLASIIRIADALDRSEMGLVEDIDCHWEKQGKTIVMRLYAKDDCHLEIWALESKKALFERTFGLELKTELVRI
ncbi:MAG: Ppx/GppA phosphatase family protein [Armatimonadota bacterium]